MDYFLQVICSAYHYRKFRQDVTQQDSVTIILNLHIVQKKLLRFCSSTEASTSLYNRVMGKFTFYFSSKFSQSPSKESNRKIQSLKAYSVLRMRTKCIFLSNPLKKILSTAFLKAWPLPTKQMRQDRDISCWHSHTVPPNLAIRVASNPSVSKMNIFHFHALPCTFRHHF